MRRRGGDFPFYCVVVLEILQYFCVLPPWKGEKSPASAVEDFCGECPSMAARRTVENIPGVFWGLGNKADAAGIPAKTHYTLIVLSRQNHKHKLHPTEELFRSVSVLSEMQTKIYILFIFPQNKKPLFRYALYQNNGLYLVEMRGFEPLF